MIIERVNRFFGYAAINRIVFQPGQAAGAGLRGRSVRSFAPCRRSWAKAFAKSPIPSFAPAWSRLARKLRLRSGPPSLPSEARRADSGDQGSQVKHMKPTKFLACAARPGRDRGLQLEAGECSNQRSG